MLLLYKLHRCDVSGKMSIHIPFTITDKSEYYFIMGNTNQCPKFYGGMVKFLVFQ